MSQIDSNVIAAWIVRCNQGDKDCKLLYKGVTYYFRSDGNFYCRGEVFSSGKVFTSETDISLKDYIVFDDKASNTQIVFKTPKSEAVNNKIFVEAGYIDFKTNKIHFFTNEGVKEFDFSYKSYSPWTLTKKEVGDLYRTLLSNKIKYFKSMIFFTEEDLIECKLNPYITLLDCGIDDLDDFNEMFKHAFRRHYCNEEDRPEVKKEIKCIKVNSPPLRVKKLEGLEHFENIKTGWTLTEEEKKTVYAIAKADLKFIGNIVGERGFPSLETLLGCKPTPDINIRYLYKEAMIRLNPQIEKIFTEASQFRTKQLWTLTEDEKDRIHRILSFDVYDSYDPIPSKESLFACIPTPDLNVRYVYEKIGIPVNPRIQEIFAEASKRKS